MVPLPGAEHKGLAEGLLDYGQCSAEEVGAPRLGCWRRHSGPRLAAAAAAATLVCTVALSCRAVPFRVPQTVQSRAPPEVLLPEAEAAQTYRPVLLLHGVALGSSEFDDIVQWIAAAHPGTEVIALKVFEDAQSLAPLAAQVTAVSETIRSLTRQRPAVFQDGYHLVCHSQGALVCRAVCQEMDDHRVHTLVSMAGPQMGIYGKTWLQNALLLLQRFGIALSPLPIPLGPFANLAYRNFYLMAYTALLQGSVSVANLWNDPFHQQEFLEGNAFLPHVNAVGPTSGAQKERFRQNFLRLQKAVFLAGYLEGSSYDSPIGLEPWHSGLFGFYAEGSETEVVPLEKQPLFVRDTFGLRTLKEMGRLHLTAAEGVAHSDWVTSRRVFETFVLPHLS